MGYMIGQSLGRYHILEQLGEGGMATVYKAYDTRLERDVAIKIIRKNVFSPDMLEQVLKRFEREAKALARLNHANIVHINDFGEYEDIPYLVMDYLPGGTLKQKLGKSMSWQEAIHWLLPIAYALDFAHRQGMVHRDVKPANILINMDGQPMLSDFGIAKILEGEETLTGAGVGIGTPEYMSPEQGLGKKIDGRADVYSLGTVLYEMVTGKKPFTADTPMAVVISQINDPLPPPRQFVVDLPEALEKLLIKALAKRPEDRFTDMASMAQAMEILSREEKQPNPLTLLQPKRVSDPKKTMDSPHPTIDQGMNSPNPIQFPLIPKKRNWLPWWLGVGMTCIIGLVLFVWLAGINPAMLFKLSIPTLNIINSSIDKTTISPVLTKTLRPSNTPIVQQTSIISQKPTAEKIITPNFDMEETFTVSALLLWQNTNIELLPGDIVYIEYLSGKWGWTGDLPTEDKGADGSSISCLNVAGSSSNDCPIPIANEGALIARIGNNTFFVGEKVIYSIPVEDKNHPNLELRMNDGDGGMHDNFGSILVKVSIVHMKSSLQMKVMAVKGWQSSEITVHPGQSLQITYLSGTWSTCIPPYGCPYTDAMGDPTQAGSPEASRNYADNIVIGCYHGSLIARIDKGVPFCVGSNYSQLIQSSGNLEFSINDIRVDDDGGEIAILVEVR